MDLKVHKKAYDEGKQKSPGVFKSDFGSHMRQVAERVKQRDNASAKAAYEDRKIKQ